MLKTEGVLHFTIPVKDLDRSEKFYTEILGMKKIRRTGHMVFLRAAGKDNFVLTFSEKPIDPSLKFLYDEYENVATGCVVSPGRGVNDGPANAGRGDVQENVRRPPGSKTANGVINTALI